MERQFHHRADRQVLASAKRSRNPRLGFASSPSEFRPTDSLRIHHRIEGISELRADPLPLESQPEFGIPKLLAEPVILMDIRRLVLLLLEWMTQRRRGRAGRPQAPPLTAIGIVASGSSATQQSEEAFPTWRDRRPLETFRHGVAVAAADPRIAPVRDFITFDLSAHVKPLGKSLSSSYCPEFHKYPY